jgi:hypothetical protein
MQKEYLASVETEFGLRHNLTKYTLSNNVEVVLSDDEMEELFKGSKLGSEIEILQSENMKLAHQKENYRGLILDFKSVLSQMEKVR